MVASHRIFSSYMVVVLIFFLQPYLYAQEEKQITGKITTLREPLENVKIAVEGSKSITSSDANGEYQIHASIGDILVYSHLGMKTVKIIVEDVTQTLNVEMETKPEQLEEVVVAKKRNRDLELEYATNKNIIKTAFGFIDKTTSAGNIKILDEDRITTNNLCILDLLRGKFAGVKVYGDCFSGGGVSIRAQNSINNTSNAIYDVDGQIFRDAPIWINIDNIKRVAVLIGFATTTLYGGFGGTGVIVINTKTGTTSTILKAKEAQKKYNPNQYDGSALPYAEVIQQNRPKYLNDLYAVENVGEAVKLFEKYAIPYANSPYFFLDSFQYFIQEWQEQEFSLNLMDKHYHLFQKNPVLLKAYAYLLEDKGLFGKAKQLYVQVIKLRTNYVQSYLDLANSNLLTNDANKALSFYLRLNNLEKKGYFDIDSLGLRPFYEREIQSAFAQDSDYLYAAMNTEHHEDNHIGDTRLVFEWNDGEAEFELQFVGPNGQYTRWKHTIENAGSIMKEKRLGYSAKDFFIDDTLDGVWQVNLKYLGNKSLTPTYLKVRMYKDYGTMAQTRTTKVFKLSVKGVNQELFSVLKPKTPPTDQ